MNDLEIIIEALDHTISWLKMSGTQMDDNLSVVLEKIRDQIKFRYDEREELLRPLVLPR